MPPEERGPGPADDLRSLPSVDRVLRAIGRTGEDRRAAAAARRVIDRARQSIRSGRPAPSLQGIIAATEEALKQQSETLLRPVVNATGVLIHTNLGRVPLGPRQLDAVVRIAGSYSNLEYDVEAGRRSSRYGHASRLLTALTGADSALVTNNNAAAVLLALTALCAGGDVLISRGQLVEIGGEFRIPDVMALSGSRLVEVGTTNRTRLADYRAALTEATAAILKVHPSNYRVIGFTESVRDKDLAGLAKSRGIPFIHDLGSGLVSRPAGAQWAEAEPPVELALKDGADIVTFSGDKLLGGPQAGIILGRSELVARIARHPLMRAVRVDKMTLAALEETLSAHLENRLLDLPLWSIALATSEELEGRARRLALSLAAAVDGLKTEAVPAASVTGGGSLPGEELSSWAVALDHGERGAAELDRALRGAEIPVIGRIEDDRLLLDLRTVPPTMDDRLELLVVSALAPREGTGSSS
jgi:L-seryl-tRNA(Ser) seleniumtransferase